MSSPIVFFDGRCNLCNQAVDFLIRHDHARQFKFAPLDGQTARELLPSELIGDQPDSVVLYKDASFVMESEAALRTLILLGGSFRLFAIAFVIPKSMRDFVYRCVARYRTTWFGRRETCRLPTAAERAQFLP